MLRPSLALLRPQKLAVAVGRSFLATCLVLGTLGPTAAAAQGGSGRALPERTLNAWIARADALVQRGRTRAGVRLLRRAAERVPEDARAPLRLYRLWVPTSAEASLITPSEALRRDVAEARRLLEHIQVESGPDAPRVPLLIAWATAVAGDHREAIDAATLAAGRLDLEAARLLRRLSALAVLRRDLIAAEQALTAARRADPVEVALVTDQATIALARGRTERAVALYREALARSPESVSILRDLAGALLAAGRAREAVAMLASVTSTCPDGEMGRCQLDLARASLEAQQLRRAERAARSALTSGTPGDPEPALVLAAILAAAGRPDEARDAYREALRRDPQNLRAREGLRAPEEPEGSRPRAQ